MVMDSRYALLQAEAALKEISRRKREHALDFYIPYPKQMEFHNNGVKYRERMLRAGNRVGKSFCGAAEAAYHLTGQYPDWWLGRRFYRPVKVWAASKTGLMTRDVAQTKLCGQYGQPSKRGTGAIPKDAIDWEHDVTLARGVADAYDTVHVTHYTNGIKDVDKSTLTFKTYDQGREKWQGDQVDVIWCDEEPPADIYSEGLARLAPIDPSEEGGIIYTTFTPLLGKTEIVARFKAKDPDRCETIMTLYDALHISQAARDIMIKGYREFEREARINGVAMMGEGRVFDTDEATIKETPFEVPEHWSLLWGIDPGVGHPFGAVLIAWDKDTDIIHVVHAVRMKDALPIQQAAAMKPWHRGMGARVPVAWPQDAHQRKEFEGKLVPLVKVYRAHGLKALPEHAQWVDGSNATELGILEMQERMASNRFKVFSHLVDWFEEFREYHRKDGQIVREGDDLMSATRIAIMDKRHARAVLWTPRSTDGRGNVAVAKDVDIDPWG